MLFLTLFLSSILWVIIGVTSPETWQRVVSFCVAAICYICSGMCVEKIVWKQRCLEIKLKQVEEESSHDDEN